MYRGLVDKAALIQCKLAFLRFKNCCCGSL